MGNSLRWKALWYVDWISVNGETDGDAEGMGDGRVSVGITHGQGTRETSSTTITFIYYDEDTGEEVGRKVVNVCRCICGCEQLDFWPEPCNCEDFEVTDIQIVHACGCDKFIIDTSPLSWDWDKTTVSTIPYIRNCIDSEITTSVTSTVADHFEVELTNDSIKINPSENNTGETPITGVVTISYSSPQEPNCSKTIELTHNFSSCQCDVLTISQSSATWKWNLTGERTITVDATDECIDFSSITVAKGGTYSEHFNVSSAKNESDRTITITVSPVGRNESTADDLTANITITYASGSKPSCTKAISLKHEKMICNCENFDVTNINKQDNN